MAGTNSPLSNSNFPSLNDWYFHRKFSPSQPDVSGWSETKSVEAPFPFTITIQNIVGLGGLSVPITFGAPTVTPGAVSVVGLGGLAIALTFGSPTVSVGAVTITGLGGLSIPLTFGDITVSPGAVSVVGLGGLSIPLTFGDITVAPGATNIVGLGGLSVPITFGAPTVTPGAVSISGLGGLSIPLSFGAIRVTREVFISLDAARTAEAWSVIIRISGLGATSIADPDDDDGRWSFCSETPAYAAGSSTWKEYLSEWPDLMSEEIDFAKGGIAASGNVTATLIDGTDNDGDRDAVTDLLRIGSPAIARLELGITPVSLLISVTGGAFEEGDVIFIGAEAMKVSEALSGTAYGVHRGVLGTDSMAHSPGELVTEYSPSLSGRRIEVSIVPTETSDPADEVPLGTYSLDGFKITKEGALAISGASLLRYLVRQVASQQPHWLLHQFANSGSLIITHVYATNGNQSAADRFFRLWPDSRNTIRIDDDDNAEIIRIDTSPDAQGTQSLRIDARGVSATIPRDHDFLSVIRPVLTADPIYGSFRFSASRSTTRSDDDWVVSSHAVDILLCLLTSSARTDDGLELHNFTGSAPNYSCLPPGWGVGLPAALIDFTSFLDVKARTASWLFPSFTLADAMSFADLANKFFLEPLGAYLTFEGGLLKFVLPRVPMLDEDLPNFNEDVHLDGSVNMELSLQDQASSVTFTYKTEAGDDVTLTFKSADFTTFVNASGLYGFDNDVAVDVPGLRSSDQGLVPFLRQLAQRKLFRLSRPQWTITLDTDLAQFGVGPGSNVYFTHPEIIDTSLGVRGGTFPAEVVTRQPSISPKLCGYHYTLRSFGPALPVARVTPSALVSSVVSSSPVILGVAANEFTCPDAPSDLPLTDAAAFTVGDVVTLKSLDGGSFADARETVTAVGANQLTLSGDFGIGDLSTVIGAVVDFANFDDASEHQQSRYVFAADASTMTVGTDASPFVYGEP